ncbi:hypothetical protein [Pedobacter gandavensis]|uniref:hypothetical protein n=1 Tax=Pedobacter gandavensis TaxID=2679963 RepID=UPI00292CA946|nr:hypothetical protein [Pedobacter gandavensis]
MMKKFTLNLKICLWALSCLIFMAFKVQSFLDEELAYLQKRLAEWYDHAAENREVTRYELNVTNSGFCRYKRFFSNGKVEYFSFNLMKFKALEYAGTDTTGRLFFLTKGEDVIVQTYNDKKDGDVDSMASFMVIPTKKIEAQDLSELSEKLIKMNGQLQVQK